MLLNVLKWVGIGIIFIFLLGFLKDITIFLFYIYNRSYRDKVDFDRAQEILVEQKRQEEEKENRRLDELSTLTTQWTNVAQYYYHYYEKGVTISDYAHMLDLLTPKIITLLGGDYNAFRKQVTDAIKEKEVKDSTKEGNKKEEMKTLSPKDFENRNLTDEDIDRILEKYFDAKKKENDGQNKRYI
jgi:hypothetical protein